MGNDKTIQFYDRKVILSRLPEQFEDMELFKCADCFSIARYLVVELENKRSSWFWCGICALGG